MAERRTELVSRRALVSVSGASLLAPLVAGQAQAQTTPVGDDAAALAARVPKSTDGSDFTNPEGIPTRLLVRQSGEGAVARSISGKAQDVISVRDYIPEIYHDDIIAGISTVDVAPYFNAALATGKNVFVPAGRYCLGSTVSIGAREVRGALRHHNGQALYGEGNYTTELRWTGTDISENCLEIRSGRARGYPANTSSGLQLRNFLITGAETAKCANLIWQENGTFHTFVEKIRSEASTAAGFLGEIGEAAIRVEGTSVSYNVHPTYRDVVISAVQQGATARGRPQPCGFWIEGAIEGTFDNCAAYGFEECWRIGADIAAKARNVQNCRFISCLGETGDRSGLSDAAKCLRIYFALNCTFVSCKFGAGEGWARATRQTPVYLSGLPGFQINQVAFIGCAIWGFTRANYAIVADSTATMVHGVSFQDCDFNGFAVGLVNADPSVDLDIRIPMDRNFFFGVSPVANGIRVRGATVDFAPIADGAGQTVTLATDHYLDPNAPLMSSLSVDQRGMILTTYRNNTAGQVIGRMQNTTSRTIHLASARARLRTVEQNEIRAQNSASWDPPAIAAGAIAITAMTVPGARLGDMVLVSFKNAGANNLSGLTLTGHVSADNTVTAIIYNGTAASNNLPVGALRAVVLKPMFDLAGSATYDPASLADGDGVTTTVTVTGAALGDFVAVSFSRDLGGVMMHGHVSAADTVAVRFQNESGGAVDLTSGTILAGVFQRRTSL